MELDLNNADTLLELVIAERCSTCEHVASVELHREPSPFTLVEMLRRDHTVEVASQYKVTICGNAALIRLEHKSE